MGYTIDQIIAQDRGIFVSWFDLYLSKRNNVRSTMKACIIWMKTRRSLYVAGQQHVTVPPKGERTLTEEPRMGDCNRDMLLDRAYIAF
jgi:hypothetical protein